MKLSDIKNYWEKAGDHFYSRQGMTPTSRDPFLGDLERENISSFLHGRPAVLELGCGDGRHSLWYLRRAKSYTGLDISSGLLRRAERRLKNEKLAHRFVLGSVLEIDRLFHPEEFDVIISQRCLINLPTWALQKRAIDGVARLLKPGGLFLVSEGFEEGLKNINSVRKKVGLDLIRTASYNKNFREEDFEGYVRRYFEIMGRRDYGLYFFLSRVFHPLAVFPKVPKHYSVLNRSAMTVSRFIEDESMKSYSFNHFFVLKKKNQVPSRRRQHGR